MSALFLEWLPSFIINVVLLLTWLLPILVALLHLRKRDLDETAKAVWVLIILVMPIIGPLAYLLMNRAKQNTNKK